ncbi:MAG: 50S ribosomal protein L32 [Betaproteobacteria bacterium AqS2]|uniref:Large ribosomal subunit protein bL32 n=1 Tax=Candidatus Amphirhobacter heronislandensis TaxID=1732024 RepID=A0A930Y1Y8_9GAMM|nr:50S ribosomal protein L32 [Betaproteobacteria bacterium AqS2]
MAVPQNRKSRSRSRMRRQHLRTASPALCLESGAELPGRDAKGTGELRRRHHLGGDGIYRGFRFFHPKEKVIRPDEDSEQGFGPLAQRP